MSSTSQKDVQGILQFSDQISNLKHEERRGWVLKGINQPERVTGHMYRMAMLSLLAVEPPPDCDMHKVMQLCLVHDLAECKTTDITPHDGIPVEEKHRMESEAMGELANMLPPPSAHLLTSLYQEYEKKESPEAKLTKDLDLFDLIHEAFMYEKKHLETGLKGLPENLKDDQEELKKIFSKMPNLDEFFCPEKVLGKVRNSQIKTWIDEILKQRRGFFQKHRIIRNS